MEKIFRRARIRSLALDAVKSAEYPERAGPPTRHRPLSRVRAVFPAERAAQ